jgi:hypothetical protein
MHICLDERAVQTIRGAARTAAEINNTVALHVDLFMCFARWQIEAVESALDDGDFVRFISSVLDGWDRKDPDQVLMLLKTCLGHLGIALEVRVDGSDVMQDTRLRHPVGSNRSDAGPLN